MDEPLLSFDERQALGRNGWFGSLSPSLRHDILRHGIARPFRDGEPIFERGRPATQWCVVVRGAAHVGFTSAGGQKLSLCYMRPGSWFSAVVVLQSAEWDYDVAAHGDTTLLTVAREDLRAILRQHAELYAALLQLHSRRTRQVYELVEEMMTLPLRARLARQLGRLVAGHGVRCVSGMRIGLPLTQDQLAQLLGASRQRVNAELMALRREGVVVVEHSRLVVPDVDALRRIGDGAEPPPRNREKATAGTFAEALAPSRLVPGLLAA